MSAGSVSVGGVVSCTVTLNDPLLVLACASTAVHPTSVVPIEKVAPEPGLQSGAMGPSTRSSELAEYGTTAPPGPVASVRMSSGSTRTGAVVSWTVILNEPVPVFECASVAVHVTMVSPRGKPSPDV